MASHAEKCNLKATFHRSRKLILKRNIVIAMGLFFRACFGIGLSNCLAQIVLFSFTSTDLEATLHNQAVKFSV